MRMKFGVRKFLRLCLVLATLLWPGFRLGAANAAAEFHCAGMAQLAGNADLPSLQKAIAAPSWSLARTLAEQKMSRLLAAGLNLETNAATLLEPLLTDVLNGESAGRFDSKATNFLGFIVAVRADAARAQFWQDKLAKAIGKPGEKFSSSGFDGLRWKRGGSDSLWMIPAQGWLIAGRGENLLPWQMEYLQQIQQNGRPAPALNGKWLEADADFSQLTPWLADWMTLFKPARVEVSVATGQDILHTEATLVYPTDMPWTSGPWQMPKELVRGQVISFSAGQDVAAFLNQNRDFVELNGNPLTNQFYSWALGGFPLLTSMAWPQEDASNTLEQLAIQAPDSFSPILKDFNHTELHWASDDKKLTLDNLRIANPSLTAVTNAAGEYLLLSIMPVPPTAPVAPDEIWNGINGRTNVVYYDWEQTGLRLQQWTMLGRMLLTKQRPLVGGLGRARRSDDAFFATMASLPGDTTTTITRVAPNELSLVRNGPVGFTGIELFLLAEWLNTSGLPPAPSTAAIH
jgi:hypothetical protein